MRRDLDAATSAYHTQLDRSAATIQDLQNTLKLQQQHQQRQHQEQQQQQQQQENQRLVVVPLKQQSLAQEDEAMQTRSTEADRQIDRSTALVEHSTMQLTALQEIHCTAIAQHNQLTSQYQQLTAQYQQLSSQNQHLTAEHNQLIAQQQETTMQLTALQETHSTVITQHNQLISQNEQLVAQQRETTMQLTALEEERKTLSRRHLAVEQERSREMERLLEQERENERQREKEKECLMEEFRGMHLQSQHQLQERDQALALTQRDQALALTQRDQALALTQQQLSEERVGHSQARAKITQLMEEVNERDDAVIQLHHDVTVLQACVSERDGAIIQLHCDISLLQGRVDERDSSLLIARQEADGAIAQLKHGMTVLQGCVDERDMQINEARISAAEEQRIHIAKLETLQTERCLMESDWQSRLHACEGLLAKITSQCASLQDDRTLQDQALCLLRNECEEEKERYLNISQATQHKYEEEKERHEADVAAHIEAARITTHSLEAADINLNEQQQEILSLTDRLEVVQTALDHQKHSMLALQETHSTAITQHAQLTAQYQQLTTEHNQVISQNEQIVEQQQETTMQLTALQETHSTAIAQHNQLQAVCRQQQQEYDEAVQSRERRVFVLEGQLQEQLQLQANLRDQLQQHQQQLQQQLELQQHQQDTLQETSHQELTHLEHSLQQMTVMLSEQQERYETEMRDTKKANAELLINARQEMTKTLEQERVELDGVKEQHTQLMEQLRKSDEEKVTPPDSAPIPILRPTEHSILTNTSSLIVFHYLFLLLHQHILQTAVARYRAKTDESRTVILSLREQVTPLPRAHQYIPSNSIYATNFDFLLDC